MICSTMSKSVCIASLSIRGEVFWSFEHCCWVTEMSAVGAGMSLCVRMGECTMRFVCVRV
uniref:Uncharacterized protein n=1 Tax=Anguilla anguilla TaxID=7936 RepID=A0A0E9WX76_ANGAN